MRFPKPPQLMSDQELVDWTVGCIKQRAPESDSLDYKSILNLETPAQRIELAKDASSFANEFGGTLLYGVPEVKENDVPIPVSLEKCGLKIDGRIPETVENILLDSVRPVLPNLFVKPVPLAGTTTHILVVHHPASWNKPHMVESYKERRYFRRGNYRAVRMSEVEVEAAYASRRSLRTQAEEFFRTADFGEIPETGQFLRVTIVPVLNLVARETMREREFIEWLRKNPPEGRRGDWVPFLNGVRFMSYATGAFNGLQFEVRLFHNGAFSFTVDMDFLLSESEALNLKHAEKVIKLYALDPTSKAIELFRIASPLVVKVEIHGARGLKALDPKEVGYSDPLTAGFALPLNLTSFTEESSSDELLGKPEQVLLRLVARLTEAFGIWSEHSI